MSYDASETMFLPTDVQVDQAISGPATVALPAFLTTDGFVPLGVVDTLHTIALVEDALHDVRGELTRAVDGSTVARRAMWAAQDALQTFRDQVRDVAVAAHLAPGGICLEGMNAAFVELGIDEYYPEVEIEFTVTVRATVTGLDESDAEDAVWSAVENAVDNLDYIDNGDLVNIVSSRGRY